MRIVFLMPGVARLPMGGFKVIFEYANRLVADGYSVTVVLPVSLIAGEPTLKNCARKWARFFLYRFFKDPKPTSWFALDSRIQCVLVPSLHSCYVPRAEVYVATAMQTALYLNHYKSTAKKFYFIQGYEFWAKGEEKLLETYRFGLRKIVISNYLKNEVEKMQEQAIRITNGFDFSKFYTQVEVSQRSRIQIGAMYHCDPLKGFFDVLRAMEVVYKRYPEVKLLVFGSLPCTFEQPYIQYAENPDADTLRGLYNNCSVFVAASHSEGFGLTIGEAMICSAAVVCTDTGGYLEMAENEQTALVCKVGDVEALSENICRLIENDDLRQRIARQGNQFIANFTWDESYQKLKLEIER